MKIKIINDLNIKKQAEELAVDIWHTPSFLFIVMGVITAVIMITNYYISVNQNRPEVLVISESIIVITIFIIGNSIIESVEQVAKLNKMKSEFVSVASHQLRSPLSAIRWETELLQSKFGEGLTPRQQEAVQTIRSLSGRMVRLVNDLLDVAKIDQGRLALKKERVDLAKIVEETINQCYAQARAHNVDIIFNRKKQVPTIIGDNDRLKLVVENLLTNGIKYTVGKGRVEIGVYEINNYLVFNIKDNGVGIPKSQQKRIFNKFFRSDNIVKHQTEGTGLGLYIAKNIVEQSGGRIWFESREGVGTVFSFSLPIKQF